MLKIQEFNFMEVKNFIKALNNTFWLTPFEPILAQIELANDSIHLSSHTEIDDSCGQGGCHLSLKIEVVDREIEKFEFFWTTSSDHRVCICLENDKYNLYIGEDESENFYWTIAEKAGVEIPREKLGVTPDGKNVFRETFSGCSLLVVYSEKGEEKEIHIDTPEMVSSLMQQG